MKRLVMLLAMIVLLGCNPTAGPMTAQDCYQCLIAAQGKHDSFMELCEKLNSKKEYPTTFCTDLIGDAYQKAIAECQYRYFGVERK